MGEFRRIKMSLFLLLVFQFTEAAAVERLFLSSTVRARHDATLSCENVINNQNNCDSTTWLFIDVRATTTVELVTLGQIGRGDKSKSDRLSVTENCSLVIKKVTVEDAGRYFCEQYKSGKKRARDSEVLLSVVTMTEQTDTKEVTLSCSVSAYKPCTHEVKWLYRGNNLDEHNQDVRTSQSTCSASATFLMSHYIYTSRFNLFTCEVNDFYSESVQQFPFSLQPSDEKPGEEPIGVTTKPTTTESTTTTLTRTTNDASTKLKDLWWVFIIVAAVVLVALLIIVVKVIRWKRDKGNKTRMNDKIGLTSDPEVTQSAPEPGQDTADPEDGVSYASVSYTKKTNSDARVRSKNDDEGDAVTYSTVKVSSTDPSNLYATIHKPQ